MRLVRLGVIAAVATTFLAVVASPALGADLIFWTEPFSAPGQIFYANLDGTSTTVHMLKTTGATVDEPWGVAPDPATGRVYWVNNANFGTGTISSASLHGGGGKDLSTPGASVYDAEGVVVDQPLGEVYWANSSNLEQAKLDGTGGAPLNTGSAPVDAASGLVIDSTQKRVYWVDDGGGPVWSARLTGGGGKKLRIPGKQVSTPEGLAIDQRLGKVYWANYNSNSLGFANLDGSGGGLVSISGATPRYPSGVAVDPATHSLYWANFNDSSIAVANLKTGHARTLYTNVGTPTFPALLTSPVGAGTPKITAPSHTVPAKLSCSQGSWASDDVGALDYQAPQKFTYRWTKNGKAIDGATSSRFTAKSGGSYGCTVTAINFAGSTKQHSPSVKISG